MFVGINRSNLVEFNRLLLPLAIMVLAVGVVGAYGNQFGRTAVSSISSLSFIPNTGLGDPAVQYTLRQPRATTYFTADGLHFSWLEGEGDSAAMETVGLQFLGAGTTAVQGENPLPGVINYLHGNDPANWRTDIPTYGTVSYENLYPNVDLTYSGDGSNLNLRFQTETGQALSKIGWQFEGGTAEIDPATGTLIMRPDGGDSSVQLSQPQLWQKINGQDVPLALSYTIGADGRIGFEATESLAASPAVIALSMLLPGLGAQDYGRDIAVDDAGNIYVTGYTTSADFPVQNPLQNFAGIWDVFVTKFSPDGSTLLYSTFIGGSENDFGFAIAVDESGAAYLTGTTRSDNFPTVNPYQSSLNGDTDSFISVLSPDGTALLYSTYFGGSWNETGFDIIPKNNHIFVTGRTLSSDFPTQNPLQPANAGGFDTFFTRLDPDTNTLVFSSYLGGNSDDFVGGMAVDAADNIVLVGETSSNNFPTTNPIQANYQGNWDFFITGIAADGGSYLFSTYLGGSFTDWFAAVGIDGSGNIHVAGSTDSNNFPVTTGGNPGGEDAVVVTLSPDGSTLLYSALLGGDGWDRAHDMVVGDDGNKYLTGFTDSLNFPVQNPIQSNHTGILDVFVTKLDTNNNIAFSTYLGGDKNDVGQAIAVDAAQHIYITGDTFSYNFPTVNAFQPGYKGGAGDIIVAKINGAGYVLDFSTYLGGGPYPGNPTAVSLTDFDGRSTLVNPTLYLAAALLLILLLSGLLIRHKKKNF